MNEICPKAKRYHDDNREELKLFVRAVASVREANGLPALPPHPKDRNEVSLTALSCEIDIAVNDLRRILPELKEIQARSKIPPLPPKLLSQLADLDDTYREQPVPVTASSAFAYEQVSRESGVPTACLKQREFISKLDELKKQSGTRLHVPLATTEIVLRLKKFAAELIETSATLPWSNKNTPNFAEIARRTGVDGERLKIGPMRRQFDKIFAEVAKPERESKDAERSRLAAYVDAQLAEGRAIPLNHKKTTHLQKIASEAGIEDHRLQMKHLYPELERWIGSARPRSLEPVLQGE